MNAIAGTMRNVRQTLRTHFSVGPSIKGGVVVATAVLVVVFVVAVGQRISSSAPSRSTVMDGDTGVKISPTATRVNAPPEPTSTNPTISFNVPVANPRLLQLDGCYDPNGNFNSMFTSNLQNVNQSSTQCLALKSLSQRFGFNSIETPCSQTTSFSAPSNTTNSSSALPSGSNSADSSKKVRLFATFCDPNTIVELVIQNPPNTLDYMPTELTNLTNLNMLSLNNAFFGNGTTILTELFDNLQSSKYLRLLSLAGSPENSNTSSRVLQGQIPELPMGLIQNQYFIELHLSRNNFSGYIPSSMSDTFMAISFSYNSFLSGPLTSSNYNTYYITGSEPTEGQPSLNNSIQWTNSIRCGFTNTALCIPPSWPYQPACLRNASAALPTCNAPPKKDVREIDPIDPMDSVVLGSGPTIIYPNNGGGGSGGGSIGNGPSSTTQTAANGSSGGAGTSSAQVAAVTFGLILVVIASAIVFVRYRRARDGNGNVAFEGFRRRSPGLDGSGSRFSFRRLPETRDIGTAPSTAPILDMIELRDCSGLPAYTPRQLSDEEGQQESRESTRPSEPFLQSISR
ncbi:hypothetical protein CcCBS67573_g03433 [Chytriomyces confervae]|uniref:L domain-like protein n=1 Tax=Chytriomyces confervae TaxID=246404 RepID=A0A507FJS4_9FUNG|nr:hypothetical protein HDU80_001310 [Chytriomyces hyalinus]TPX75317.1 hypothetical protein CcCBS67573_g03433 [Chytriomyces confervae]